MITEAGYSRARILSFARGALTTALLAAVFIGLAAEGALTLEAVVLMTTIASFVPLPLALASLRHGWQLAAIATPLLFVGALACVYAGTGGDFDRSLLAAVLVAWAGGVLALTLWSCGMGRPFQKFALTACVVATLGLYAVPVGASIARHGNDQVHALLQDYRDRTRDVLVKMCRDDVIDCESPAYEPSGRELARTGRVVLDNPLMVTIPSLAGTAFLMAFTMLELFRWLGARAQLPVHRRDGIDRFEAGWPIPYVIAGGLGLVILRWDSIGADDPLAIAGVTIAVLGVLPLILQGIAVTAYLFRRLRIRTWVKVAFWIFILLSNNILLPIFAVLGLLEMGVQLRRRLDARAPSE